MNITEKHQCECQEQTEIFPASGEAYVCTQASDIEERGEQDGIGKVCQWQKKQRSKKAGFQKRLPPSAQKQAVAELCQTEKQDACLDGICENQEIVCACSKKKGAWKKAHLWDAQEWKIPNQAEKKAGKNKNIFGDEIQFSPHGFSM